MIITRDKKWLESTIIDLKLKDKPIGFVPTMGGLHAGHLALISAAKKNKNSTVCSIFVNPTQFNDPEDYKNYPVTIEDDIFLLEKEGVDILYLPEVTEIYPQGTGELESYDLGEIEFILEGKSRPGHFQGVCQVVHRLLKKVDPDVLYLGQKDFQQCMVLKKMLDLTGLHTKISIEIVPTIREESGLAMSSRNMRLTEEMRKKASSIYQSLQYISQNFTETGFTELISSAEKMITDAGLKPDYLVIADSKTLKVVESWEGEQSLVALIAAYAVNVRLIDNMVIT